MERIDLYLENIKLAGALFKPAAGGKNRGAVLFIHGWKSKQDRFYQLAQNLSDKGFTCLTFDLPGHGESEGNPDSLSIAIYFKAVTVAYDFLAAQSNMVSIVGSSFGSYLAAILISKRPIKNLILRTPSNYPDEEFSRVGKIRTATDYPDVVEWRKQKFDYSATESLRSVHQFNGHILIVESEKDEMVPHQTVENYLNAVPDKTKLTYYLMKDAPHSLTGYPAFIQEFNKLATDWLSKHS